MKKVNTFTYTILTAFFAVFFISFFCGGSARVLRVAASESSAYTDVLEDLQKDSSFDTGLYPDNSKDYSIQVIQIAESTDSELFVYTYQPCQKTHYLVATSVNMSLSEDVSGTRLYDLILVNTNGVFAKYLVQDVEVSTDTTRYYNISSIYRIRIEGIDEETDGDNTVDEVAFKVGQQWKVTTENGEVTYSFTDTEVVTVTDKYVGLIDYPRGFNLFQDKHCYSHYVAFSTDWDMDTLDEVEVAFIAQPKPVYSQFPFPDIEYDEDPIPMQLTWTSQDYANNAPSGLFGKLYEEKRIQTVEEFKASESLLNSTLEALKDKQWVLRFFETAYTTASSGGGTMTYSTEVTDVTLLRFKFTKDGKVYNLGVVDTKQTGSNLPSNEPYYPTEDKGDWIDWLCNLIFGDSSFTPIWGQRAIVICGLVIIVLVLIFTSPLWLSWLIKFIIAIFKGLWWLIRLPFRALKKLFTKKKE